MNSKRIRELLAAARARPANEREHFLATACGSDLETRAEVESLLHARASLGTFLEDPAVESLLPREPSLASGSEVAAFRIIREIGAGGSGTVYEAEQKNPQRRVALKMLRRAGGEEADFLARLQHPGIAHVYEAGLHEGRGYVALEFVDGARNLDAYVHAAALDKRAVAVLVAEVCDAVHHGHQKGVIHQDLKPGNILVDSSGRPKVIDFGIARRTHANDVRELRGTVPYLSPQRCGGAREVDLRDDVYALGVILYELLAKRLPHAIEGKTVTEALRIVRDTEPHPLPRDVGGDLRAIIRKAIARAPEERYASAAALADDLRRYITHHPVEARKGGLLYQARQFARRQRVATLAALTVLGVSIFAAVVNRGLVVEKERERQLAERRAYVANIAAAAAALRVYDVAEARRRLDLAPLHLRGWEWKHLHGRLDESRTTLIWPGRHIMTAAVSPRGLVVVNGRFETTNDVRAWEIESGQLRFEHPVPVRVTALGFEGAGDRFAAGFLDGRVQIRAAADGAVLADHRPHRASVNAVVFVGQDILTASSDGTVRILSPPGASRILSTHEDRVICLAVDAPRQRLYIGDRSGQIRVWDLEGKRVLHHWKAHRESVESLAVDPDGNRLVSVSRDHTVRLWNARTRALVAVRRTHTSNVRWVAFRPDGRTFATASWDRTIRVWQTTDAEELRVFAGHRDHVTRVLFTPAGKLLSVGMDGMVKLWDPDRPAAVPTLRGHRDRIMSVAFHPNGEHVASASRDGTVRLWNLAGSTSRIFVGTSAGKRSVAFLEAGRRLVATCSEHRLHAWFVDRRPAPSTDREIDLIDGGRDRDAAVVARGTSVWEWDWRKGRRSRRWTTVGSARSLARHRESGRIAVGTADGWVQVLGGERTRIGSLRVVGLAWSPDGSHLVATTGGKIVLLDATTLRTRAVLRGHGSMVHAVAYSPDGTRIASGSQDATLRLWDPDTGEQVAVLYGHRHPIYSVAFSPDGTKIASGGGVPEGRDSVIKIWKTR